MTMTPEQVQTYVANLIELRDNADGLREYAEANPVTDTEDQEAIALALVAAEAPTEVPAEETPVEAEATVEG